MADPSVTLFGPLDTVVGPYMEYVVLVLVAATFLTRKMAHDAHVRQAEEGGADAIERYTPHAVTLWALVLASLYYLTLHHHSGMVLSVLVLGMFVTEVFDFEARQVEAREGRDLEPPKASLALGVLSLLYAAYVSLFFLVAPYWNQVV